MKTYPRMPPRLDRVFPRSPVFFVTCCTYRRRKILANERVSTAFREFALRANSQYNIAVGRYVLMPDHLHFFVCGSPDFELGKWMGMLKQYLAKRIDGDRSELPTANPRFAQRSGCNPVWQRGFFDHVLRSDESYAQKWDYVRENPVRAGLVKRAEDWPYAGEIVLVDRA